MPVLRENYADEGNMEKNTCIRGLRRFLRENAVVFVAITHQQEENADCNVHFQ